MYSLDPKFLQNLKLPAQTLAGLKALHQFDHHNQQGVPKNLPTLAQKIHVHSSDAAVRGYQEALNVIHQAEPPLVFQADILLTLHEKLFHYLDGSGGQFKSQNNKLFKKTQAGELSLVHTPFSAEEIPQAMEELIQRYNEAMQSGQYDPFVLLPLTLMDFIFIHPFFDGNGRSFRLLSVLLLIQSGCSAAKQLHLDKVLQNSRGSGQEALKAGVEGWREGKHQVLPWLHYFLGALSYAHTQVRPGIECN